MSIYDLKPEEVYRQREVLQETRDRQRKEIIESGLAQRAISSPAFINNPYGSNYMPLTEGSDFHPSRRTLGNYPSFRVEHLFIDLGIHSPAYDLDTYNPFERALIAINPPTYMLNLERSEPIASGELSATIPTRLTVGVQLSEKAQRMLRLDSPLLPIPGIEDEDVSLVQRHLLELDTIRTKQNLALLDPTTLDEEPEFTGF